MQADDNMDKAASFPGPALGLVLFGEILYEPTAALLVVHRIGHDSTSPTSSDALRTPPSPSPK
jgi:hypothetical protein